MAGGFLKLGLIGQPVSHSLSPVLHGAALSASGLAGEYALYDVGAAELEATIDDLVAGGLRGFNVTVPHKQRVFRLCSSLAEEASLTGAVNTVAVEAGGVLRGHNTDLPGFAEALAASLPAGSRLESACVIGAGGAARAAICALARRGLKRLVLAVRDEESGRALAADITRRLAATGCGSHEIAVAGPQSRRAKDRADLLVNATPIGLGGGPVPDWVGAMLVGMGRDGLFFDMVYSRSQEPTPLTAMAAALDVPCVDGVEMLVRQAAFAFEIWTGRKADLALMRQALESARLQHRPS